MPDFVLSAEAARDVRDIIRRQRQFPQNTADSRDRVPHFDAPEPPLLVKNDNAGTVPAYGLMIPNGTVDLSGLEPIIHIDKPSTTFSRIVLVNGPSPIASGEVRPCQRQGGPYVQFAYDSGTPTFGDGWGPKASQWTATKNYPAAIAPLGVTDSTNKIAVGRLDPINVILGELAGSLSMGGSATVNIYGGAPGSEAAISGLTITAHDWLLSSGSLSSGTHVVCEWINGNWYVTAAGC